MNLLDCGTDGKLKKLDTKKKRQLSWYNIDTSRQVKELVSGWKSWKFTSPTPEQFSEQYGFVKFLKL